MCKRRRIGQGLQNTVTPCLSPIESRAHPHHWLTSLVLLPEFTTQNFDKSQTSVLLFSLEWLTIPGMQKVSQV